jgi:hypothetical protein
MVHKVVLGVALLALGVSGAVAVAGQKCSPSSCATGSTCSPDSKSAAASSCAPGNSAVEATGGKLTGRFDPAMSSVCRFSCAAKVKHLAKDVFAQPGAVAGRLTQCPVSGVVFAVDAGRPHVKIAGQDYATCCGSCATKLRKDPRRYLKV